MLALATRPVTADETPVSGAATKEAKAPVSKAERTGLAGPFHGTLTAKTDASITVKERTFEVTSQTKIMKDGKPATLADGEIGQPVAGQFQKRDGKLLAKMIRFGGKGEPAPKVSKVGAKSVAKPEAGAEGK